MQDPVSQKPKLESRRLVKTTTPGVYKRGNRYVAVFRDQTGKQRRRAARTLAEARDLKAKLIADVRRGEYQPESKVTFAAYAPEWIRRYKGRTKRGLREVTRNDYRQRLEPAIKFFGRTPLGAITVRRLKDYEEQLANRGLAANTIRLHFAPVKALLATAHEDGIIRSNPAAGLRLTASSGEEQERVKAMTEEELCRLLQEIPVGWRFFFEFLAHSGLRIGEAVALRWSDVDLIRRRVTITRRYYAGGFAAPKSRYGERTIPLPARIARELELRFLVVEDPDALLFSSERGTVIDSSNLMSRVLKPAARRAGVPWVGFHTFRHTCATILFRRGLNAKQVQLWLGHHSPAFTLETYVHLIADDLPEIDFLGDLASQLEAVEASLVLD